MWGAIIGDIVGSRFEFNNYKKKDFEFFSEECFFTDDTVMTIAVANALIKGKDASTKELEQTVITEMCSLAQDYRDVGYGSRFYNFLFYRHQPYNSFGNGAAMRISFVGEACQTIEDVKKVSAIVTGVSHNHPEAIKGAESVAVAIFMAKAGKSKSDIKKHIVKHYYPEIEYMTCDNIRPDYEFDETCQGSVPQSFVCFFEGMDFEDVIRNAISIGGDSDTIAAIAGSIAEAHYGVPIEMIKYVKDNYLTAQLNAMLEEIDKELNKHPTTNQTRNNMTNNNELKGPIYTPSKLDRAIEYAVRAHSGTKRKGTDVPFILHPLEALTIASTLTLDEDVLCAAVLHDTVEDTDTTIDEIKANFGKSVAEYVLFESENKRKGVPESESWKTRKIESLNLLNKADINEQILVLSDKLANMRAIYRDYQTLGDKLWERFNVKEKQEHAWYYGEIAKRLNLLFGTFAYKEYIALFEKVFGKING